MSRPLGRQALSCVVDGLPSCCPKPRLLCPPLPLLLSPVVVPLTLHPQVFATASTDTTIKLWDMRALSSSKGATPKPLATGGHPQACQAALFAPDGAWMGGGREGGGCIAWLAAAVHHCASAAAAVATHPLPPAPQACAAWCQFPFATPRLLMRWCCILTMAPQARAALSPPVLTTHAECGTAPPACSSCWPSSTTTRRECGSRRAGPSRSDHFGTFRRTAATGFLTGACPSPSAAQPAQRTLGAALPCLLECGRRRCDCGQHEPICGHLRCEQRRAGGAGAGAWGCRLRVGPAPPSLPLLLRCPAPSLLPHAGHYLALSLLPELPRLSCPSNRFAAEQPLHDRHPLTQRGAPPPACSGSRYQQRAHSYLPLTPRGSCCPSQS